MESAITAQRAGIDELEGYKTAVEAAGLGTWQLDLSGDRSWIRSLRHDQLFGYSDAQSHWDVATGEQNILQEDRHIYRAALAKATGTDELLCDFRVRWPDGSIHWIAMRGRVIHDEQRTPLRLAGIVVDITSRKHTEATLRTGADKYQAVFDTMDEGFCVLQVLFDDQDQPVDCRYLETNRAFERHTGLRNPVGRTMREMVPGIESFWLDVYAKVSLTGEPVHFVDHALPIRRWFDVNAFRIGAPEEHRVAILFNDITKRRQAEESICSSEARQRFLLMLNDRLRRIGDHGQIQFEAARATGKHLRVARVGYGEVHEDDERIVVTRNYTDGVPGIEGTYPFADFGTDLIHELRLGRTVVRSNVANDPTLSDPEKNAQAALQVGASVTVPLVKGGRLRAVLFLHSAEARSWTPDELVLTEEVAARTWEAAERARAEAARKRSQELLQLIIDNVPGLVSYLDPDLRYQFANRRYLEWFGDRSLVGERVVDVAGTEAFSRVAVQLGKALGGEDVRFEQYLPYDNAQPRHAHITYIPDKADDGSVRGVISTVQDVTPQRLMEQALRRSEERLQQVFSQAPVAIAVFRGPEHVAEMANPFFEELVQGREVVGRRLVEIVPEIGGDVLDAFEQVFATGEPYVRTEFYIPYDQDSDGVVEDHWFNVVYHPLRDPDGAVSGLVAVCNEVTAQVLARKELERVNRELEEFAYVASHDLQEPLRMVNVYTQLLLRRQLKGDPAAEKYSGFIRQGVIRMESLIRDLLTYSRTVQPDDGPAGVADLSASLHEALIVMRDSIEANEATVVADDLPTVEGDTAQLVHVFQNLVSNALKYRKPSVAPVIRIRAQVEDAYVTVAVQDNGIGFEPQYAQRIFGLFKRLHKNEYPGTGLGLAICQRIVERYGGSIWADAVPGDGAAFSFRLLRAVRD